MCNHELKRLFYTKDADYDIQTCRVDSENGKDKYTLCYCEKCGQVFVMEIAKTYTEPDRKAIEDEVWEFAREMISTSEHEVSKMWGCVTNFGEVMHNTTYQEAKEKYEAWKKQKDEIRVGDEIDIDGEITVVTMINKYGEILSVDCGGMTYYYHMESQLKRAKKTGRHFYEVEDLLKKMGDK